MPPEPPAPKEPMRFASKKRLVAVPLLILWFAALNGGAWLIVLKAPSPEAQPGLGFALGISAIVSLIVGSFLIAEWEER
jgi:hypothetical protein